MPLKRGKGFQLKKHNNNKKYNICFVDLLQQTQQARGLNLMNNS